MTTDNYENDLLLVTDQHGVSYIVPRITIQHTAIPKGIVDDVHSFLEARSGQVQAYGEGNWLVAGVLGHMGLKDGDKGWDGNFDLKQDGIIDANDYQAAKDIWYQQYGEPVPPRMPPGSG